MQLKDIYLKDIKRPVNPAVSATKLDIETVNTEIEEYVFTDEILNGLYRILDAIRNNRRYDHVGIWIDGYYGSGKSHFLKFLDYCITPETRDAALKRLKEAVEDIDPLDDSHNLEFTREDLAAVTSWLKKATVDTAIFNLETSFDQSTDKKGAFLQVFWSEFNRLRGFNEFNITLAQTLEKPLQEKGVFEEFKKRVSEAGGNWDTEAADIIDNELQWVLDLAKDLAPTLDTESIRQRILNRDINMSIKSFAKELNSWLKDKDENYRLILLADEVSQFINKERDRYLNLQEIVTHLSEECKNKVWIACTAQQDESEVREECNVAESNEKTGKIMGRFEVKVSLKGTQPEVITQKRILEKNGESKKPLIALYKKEENGFSQRFSLPSSYEGYDGEENFIDYYPFVPYQFRLIMQVFNNFLNLGYVAKEVKGNERSIIKVVHSTARNNAENELGSLISFDQLYDNMFETGLQARGQKAIKNAQLMAEEYSGNTRLAKRVVNVLFMICNISETDKLMFPATLQNITTLLLNDFTTPFLTLKEDIKKVLDYLCEKNVIREEKPAKKGLEPFYSFYSQEEMKVAQLITSQVVDTNFQSEQLKDIIQKYFTSLRNKEQYKTRAFSVGASVMQRNMFGGTNPDVTVEFNMDANSDVGEILLRNKTNNLVFLLGKDFHADRKLVNDFAWYCKVQRYIQEIPVANEENARVRDDFGKRALESLNSQIIPKLRDIMDKSVVISGSSEIDATLLSGRKGPDKYSAAISHHLSNIYPQAGMVENPSIPRDTASLRSSITRPVQPGEYEGMNAALTPPENEVERYLSRQGDLDVNLSQITAKFAQPPYGWLDTCTLYIVNELVRRHRRDYSFNNNRNVDTSTVASKIVSETNKFSVREGKTIPQDLVNRFLEAWKKIFGTGSSIGSSDSSQAFRNAREKIDEKIKEYEKIISQNRKYNFIQPLENFVDMLRRWLLIRDVTKFFNTIIDESEMAASSTDTCREVAAFVKDQLGRFNNVMEFAAANRDNFSFLPESLKDMADELQGLADRNWPFQIRDYIKKKKEIESALEDLRNQIREKIRLEYEKTYRLLCQSAKDEGVEVSFISEPEEVYTVKCNPENILILKNNLNTDDYFSREAEKIQMEKLRRNPPVTHTGGTSVSGPAGVSKPYPSHCTITLDTRAVSLDSEEAVDKYLAALKKKIMEKINDNKIVTIK